MSKQVIRVRSSAGQQRLEIIPTEESFISLKNKIAYFMKMLATDISLHPEDQRSPAVNVPDNTLISRIPQLREQGVLVIVKEKQGSKTQQVVNKEPPKPQFIKSNQCQHGPTQRCINCEPTDKKKDEEKKRCTHGPKERCINCISGATLKVANSKMEIEEESKENKDNQEQVIDKSKCTHGPGGKCLNCIVVDKCKDKIKQGMKANCQHGPNGKCVHCMGSEFISSAKHIAFDQFWHERILKCKNTHSPTDQCPHCTPLPNMTYKVKRDCKGHEPFPKAMCAKCIPPSVGVNRQPYRHVDFCSIMNVKEFGSIVSSWIKSDFQESKFGWLYGYYAEDPNYPLGIRAVVEGVYEQKQIGDMNGTHLLDDVNKENADRIASALGFELIGQVYTSISHDIPLSQQETRQAARYQDHYRVQHQTGYTVSKFITCVLRTGKQNPSDVAPEVYMVSDQAMDFERDDIFTESDERKLLKIRKSKDEKDIIPSIIQESKPSTEFDPSWFIVNIGVGNMADTRYNVIKHHEFPVCNRQESEQTPQFVKKFLSRFKKEPSYVRFADFHLLIYLSKLIDIDTAMTIARYVAEEQEIPKQTEEFVDTMLSNYH